ncbi:putative methyltransferase PMT2 [Abeliophyllum distichum]|uniref:Methyltransferase n=1 Tax=Abeliophyllum distichum TaxID=126358 RepID=A0ABD1VZZ6_9LAMI
MICKFVHSNREVDCVKFAQISWTTVFAGGFREAGVRSMRWCDFADILLEMDRILRPEGAVIFRDEVDVLIKVKKMIGGMRWDAKLMDHEDGPLVPEKIPVAVKQYWVGNSTSTQ